MSSNCIIIDRVFNLVSFLFHLVFLDIIMIPIDIFVLAVMLIIFFTVCRLLFKNSFNNDFKKAMYGLYATILILSTQVEVYVWTVCICLLVKAQNNLAHFFVILISNMQVFPGYIRNCAIVNSYLRSIQQSAEIKKTL